MFGKKPKRNIYLTQRKLISTCQSQSKDTSTSSGGRSLSRSGCCCCGEDETKETLQKSRLRWGSCSKDTKPKWASSVHVGEVVREVVGPVLRVPHHVLHVPPDGTTRGRRGKSKESREEEQAPHSDLVRSKDGSGVLALLHEDMRSTAGVPVVKLSSTMGFDTHADSITDLIGYSTCGLLILFDIP